MNANSKTRAEVWSHVLEGTDRLIRVLEMINTRSDAEQANVVPSIKRALAHLAECVAWLERDLCTTVDDDMLRCEVKKKDELN